MLNSFIDEIFAPPNGIDEENVFEVAAASAADDPNEQD